MIKQLNVKFSKPTRVNNMTLLQNWKNWLALYAEKELIEAFIDISSIDVENKSYASGASGASLTFNYDWDSDLESNLGGWYSVNIPFGRNDWVDNRFKVYKSSGNYISNSNSISEPGELPEAIIGQSIQKKTSIRTVTQQEARKLAHQAMEDFEKKWEAYYKQEAKRLITSR